MAVERTLKPFPQRQSDTVAYIAVAVLAFSNGYIASNSMMLGPQQVPVCVSVWVGIHWMQPLAGMFAH